MEPSQLQSDPMCQTLTHTHSHTGEQKEDEEGKVVLKTTAEHLPGTAHEAGEAN